MSPPLTPRVRSLSESGPLSPLVYLGRIFSFIPPSQSLRSPLAHSTAPGPSPGPYSSRFVNPTAQSRSGVPLLTCGISRSPPHLAFPIPLGIPSLTSGPTRSPLFTSPSLSPSWSSPSLAILLGVPSALPVPVPSRSPEALTTPFPGCSWPLLRVPAPGLRLSLWRPRSHLSTVTRDPVATAFSHSCPESLLCRVLACCDPTRSLPPASPRRASLSTQDPRCRRCCCPRCGSARGGQSHPIARSVPRPHSAPPSTPPPDAL